MALRVLHLSTYDANGGAARAASALNRAMQKQGIDSRLVAARGARFAAARSLDRQLWRLQTSPTQTWRSPARFASITAKQINRSQADVVNLHWVTDGFLSIEEIGKITKPLVWSMYDMWPFTGTEHYGDDSPDARWRSGYTKFNRPRDERGIDLDRWTFERKRTHWALESNPIHMVPASTWLENSTKRSALMHDWPITRISHVVDTDVFAPMPKTVARQRLGLPQKPPIILFLASAGINDRRKGFDFLERALPELVEAYPDLNLAIAGPVPTSYQPPANVTAHWLGSLHGDDALRLAYCAADVLVAPSREDNMPLTAMEAQSCGLSVVAFDVGGLPDIIVDKSTGYLASSGDIASLAIGLTAALNDSRNEKSLGQFGRIRAISTWSGMNVVDKYLSLYEKVAQ